MGATANPDVGDDGSNDPSSAAPAQTHAPAASPSAPGSTSTTPPPAPTPSKVAFVTSALVAGTDSALDSRKNADALCNKLASAASLKGTYAAWLSDASASAAMAGVVKGGVRYVRPDGVMITADLLAAMKAKTSFASAIAIDERLGSHTGGVWTFTTDEGKTGETCSGGGSTWAQAGAVEVSVGGQTNPTGTLGTIGVDSHAWTESGTSDHCDEKKPIYCFEQ